MVSSDTVGRGERLCVCIVGVSTMVFYMSFMSFASSIFGVDDFGEAYSTLPQC